MVDDLQNNLHDRLPSIPAIADLHTLIARRTKELGLILYESLGMT